MCLLTISGILQIQLDQFDYPRILGNSRNIENFKIWSDDGNPDNRFIGKLFSIPLVSMASI
jgi:hypothetical protein